MDTKALDAVAFLLNDDKVLFDYEIMGTVTTLYRDTHPSRPLTGGAILIARKKLAFIRNEE